MNTIKNYTEGIEPLNYYWDKISEGGFKNGELSVMASVRQTGKSVLNNLCAEILATGTDWDWAIREYSLQWLPDSTTKSKPKSPYKFSRNWHIGVFEWKDQREVHQWCQENFGPMPKTPDAWSRWKTMPANQIAFRDEQDYVLFLLKWA